MQLIDATTIQRHMNFPELISSIRQSFAGDFGMPPRQVLPLNAGQHDAFALLPALPTY